GGLLWDKINDIEIGQVMTGHWKAHEGFVPKNKHVQSKAETFTVVGYNSLFRHFLARVRRKSRKSKCYTNKVGNAETGCNDADAKVEQSIKYTILTMPKYETAQKDREIALKNLEIERNQVQINRQKARQQLFVAGMAILVLVLGFVVFYFVQKRKHHEELHHRHLEEQKQKEQLKAIKQSLEAGEQERTRLADQLHDDVAPLLVGLRNSIDDIGERFPNVPVFKKISDNISIVHSEVRNISHVLYPFSVSGDDFADSLQNHIHNFEHANKIGVKADISNMGMINKLPGNVQNIVYRSIQELMNNVVKHAGATEINLTINIKNEKLNLLVRDNGKGFGDKEKEDGVGLRRIKKGLEIFKGKMEIENIKTGGTGIKIEIPVGK
ncbi:MAG: hypothetical protein GXO89_15980, partial [Chlorobi bacterium]|nr:hypothetical protein [Chlorobiota bacterium]